jgi:hypothetical protein
LLEILTTSFGWETLFRDALSIDKGIETSLLQPLQTEKHESLRNIIVLLSIFM